jgi:putative aminopeptidase FrvX
MEEVEKSKKEIVIGFESDDSVAFMKKYLNNPSPSGFESSLGSQKIFADYIRPYVSDITLDAYGSLIATTGNMNSDYKVVIESHADEVSYYVNYFDSGFIRVVRNAGSDVMITPSMRVNVHTRSGKTISGVFGSPPIHIHKGKFDINLESIFIDVGATSNDELKEMGIEVGNVITLADGYFESFSNKWIVGRSLDNKIGGFLLSQVLRRIKEENIELPFKLIMTNSSMEESGTDGSFMNSKFIKPNVALVVDVCHDTTAPCYNEKKEGRTVFGEGGVLTISPKIHNNLLNFWRDCLDRDGIKYQIDARTNHSGTDADNYASSNSVSSLISIPLSFMHTSCEKVFKEDIEVIIQSFISILKEIKEGQDFGYKL